MHVRLQAAVRMMTCACALCVVAGLGRVVAGVPRLLRLLKPMLRPEYASLVEAPTRSSNPAYHRPYLSPTLLTTDSTNPL